MYGERTDRSWAPSGIHNGLGVAGIGGMVGNEHTVFLTRHPQSNGRTRHGRKGGSWRCMEMLWWYDLDTPKYRLQHAHAHLVFEYQRRLHEWSIWVASVFVHGEYRRRRCGTLLVQTVREWHRRLAIEGLIHSGTQEDHEDIRQFWRSQRAYSDGSAKYVTNFLIRGC